MENLFRFVLTRPASVKKIGNSHIQLAQKSIFQTSLSQVPNGQTAREHVKAVTREFITTSKFVGDPTNLIIYEQLKEFADRLDRLKQKDYITNAEVVYAIEEAFGSKLADLIEKKSLDASMESLRDSIVAIKLLPEEHNYELADLTNQLRDIEVILKVAQDKDFPLNRESLRSFRHRSLMLPVKADFSSILSTEELKNEVERLQKEAENKKLKEAETKLDSYKQIKEAIEELTHLGNENFQRTPQNEIEGFLVPREYQPMQVFIEDMKVYKYLNELSISRAKYAIEKVGQEKESETQDKVIFGTDEGTKSITSLFSHSQLFQSGTSKFNPIKKEEVNFSLLPSAERLLSSNTVNLLKEKNISISEHPLDAIVSTLNNEMIIVSKEIDSLLGRPINHTFKRIGNSMVMIKTPMPTVWNNMVSGNDFGKPIINITDRRIPHTHGSVAASGVADLLIVKQQLIGYEGTDIAHIENILKGEKKEREHTRRRETEEFTLSETESTTSEERELESTNRFEMSRETSETIKEDASLKAGLKVSGKYGPFVEFSASVEGSYSHSKEEATKTAAKFSQDVTQRSANKVTERVLERNTLRVTNEVIEKNNHTLDNVNGAGHISGVYQWVNKVYQAQMFNYGIRLFYDFMVPEPGAFLIAALQNNHANAIEIEKPMPFNKRPDEITETNYHSWVQLYGATDISAPPDMFKTKSIDFKAGGGDSHTDYNHSGQIQIDEDYEAIYGAVACVRNIWDGNADIDVALGSKVHRFVEGSSWVWRTELSYETDSIPFAMKTFRISHIGLAVEVKCRRTSRAMVKWQLDTHSKLIQAYKARLSEYEEKLASLEMQAGVAISGKDPQLNMELMENELKKNCISILTEQHFDLFNSISNGSNGLPEINLYENAGEGPYVRFFEQAFEWEHMTWINYPYFWGRKSQWETRITYDDVDPVFNQFLKAGYCRVMVPARSGFEGAIDHFMTCGEIWNGGSLPTISNSMYLAIADEIAERLDRQEDEIPQGDPWMVRIPTTLVHLRPDDKLPMWAQDINGKWVEQ